MGSSSYLAGSRGAPKPLRAVVSIAGSWLLRSARHPFASTDQSKRQHLDRIVDVFHEGYRHGCESRDVPELVEKISSLEPSLQGFAFEGAAMSLTMLDMLSPWREHSLPLLMKLADRHTYVLHVGVGWALARLGSCEGRRFAQLDPVLRWLALDGVGFHDGYMVAWQGDQRLPRRNSLSPYGARVFDQGLGRSLWFTTAIDPVSIARAIALVDRRRQADIWSGVGLACAYAGGATRDEIAALRITCGEDWPHLAQGVAFGAEAHARSGAGVPAHTDLAASTISGTSALAAARAARAAAIDLNSVGGEPAYETWREHLRASFQKAPS